LIALSRFCGWWCMALRWVSTICCGVLGRQHKEERCGATGQAGQEAVVRTELDCLTTVAERRTLSRLLTILDNVHHPPHSTVNRQKSIFSGRLLSLSCSSDRLRKSFVPRAIQLFNATQKGRGREMDFSAY